PIVLAVEIFEDAIFIGEHQERLGSVASPSGGLGIGASLRFAASPGFFAASSLAPASPRSADFPLALNSAGSVSVVGPPTGAELMRSICGPGFGVFPADRSLMMRVKLSAVRSS